MWDLPGPGLKPVSPGLAGGFLTTAPPGKPRVAFLKCIQCSPFFIRCQIILAQMAGQGLRQSWHLPLRLLDLFSCCPYILFSLSQTAPASSLFLLAACWVSLVLYLLLGKVPVEIPVTRAHRSSRLRDIQLCACCELDDQA